MELSGVDKQHLRVRHGGEHRDLSAPEDDPVCAALRRTADNLTIPRARPLVDLAAAELFK